MLGPLSFGFRVRGFQPRCTRLLPFFFAPRLESASGSSLCRAEATARMLRVNLVPTASGAKRITNLCNHTSVLQHLRSARARSLQALAPRKVICVNVIVNCCWLLQAFKTTPEKWTPGTRGPLNMAISPSPLEHLELCN